MRIGVRIGLLIVVGLTVISNKTSVMIVMEICFLDPCSAYFFSLHFFFHFPLFIFDF